MKRIRFIFCHCGGVGRKKQMVVRRWFDVKYRPGDWGPKSRPLPTRPCGMRPQPERGWEVHPPKENFDDRTWLTDKRAQQVVDALYVFGTKRGMKHVVWFVMVEPWTR